MRKEYITIGTINISKLSLLCDNITTDEVIITFKQIEHIENQRKGLYDQYKNKLFEIIANPDYILDDPKQAETGLIIKKYEKNIVIVLKINRCNDNRKNPIITMWEIKDKRLESYLKTHKTIYKKE